MFNDPINLALPAGEERHLLVVLGFEAAATGGLGPAWLLVPALALGGARRKRRLLVALGLALMAAAIGVGCMRSSFGREIEGRLLIARNSDVLVQAEPLQALAVEGAPAYGDTVVLRDWGPSQ